MWYYAKKNKERVGPISDPAIVDLFKKGSIKPSTKVWDTKKRSWQKFESTELFEKTVKNRRNRRLEDIKMRTRVFRAVSMSLIILLGYKMFLFWQAQIHPPYDVSTIFDIQDMQNLLAYNESTLMLQIASITQLGILLGLFIMLAAWMSSAVKCTKSISSRLTISSNTAIVATLVPVANIILIPAILKRIYRTLEISVNGKRNIVSLIFLRTWMFIWFMTWISFTYNRWGISLSSDSEIIQSIYLFRIFNSALQILLLFATMILITKTYLLIRKKSER